MKSSKIVNTNSKGQIVIPSEMRKALGIVEEKQLEIKVVGSSIVINPIEEIITLEEASDIEYKQSKSHEDFCIDDNTWSDYVKHKKREKIIANRGDNQW